MPENDPAVAPALVLAMAAAFLDQEPVVGSYASSSSAIRDVIASHNRAHYHAGRQHAVPSSYRDPTPLGSARSGVDDDPDSAGFYADIESDVESALPSARLPVEPADDTDADDYEGIWDANPAALLQPSPRLPAVDEHTPLLHPRASCRTLVGHRPSVVSIRPVRPPGRSTFRQTLFNASALLLGIGMLSEPLAFSYAGWIGGTLLIALYGYMTCYTAKFLARIVIADPSVRSYADIGLKAFGPRSASIVSVIFCLEVFTLSVILETLYADSLHAVLPVLSSNTYKVISIVFLIPSVFLPLSALSYTSLTGIISTVCLVLVIFVDGLTKTEAPGSILDPAQTSLLPAGWEKLGLAFGLFMAGFGAHAAMPSIAEDMQDPSRFEEAMNYSFGFATLIYALIGMAGYLMFGDDVSEEVSQNLLGVPGYSKSLNQVVLWMLVLAALTKFPLSLRPLNITLEILLGLDNLRDDGDDGRDRHAAAPGAEPTTKADSSGYYASSVKSLSTRVGKRALFVAERTFFVLFAVVVSIYVPDFSAMMAILGAFTTFLLCIIGPLAAKLSLEGANARDALFLAVAVPMAVWGSAVAFMPK